EAVATPYGDALMRQDVLPLPALEPHPGNVAYVDTETTVLSGGAGTYVFAAAIARPIDCGLRLAQLFLPHPGMEPALLAALQDELAPAFGLATFNGGSFDLPVLRTRWVMARMNGELDHPRHVDLLTLVRSLYRHRMEQCNLRTVEERLLGYEREDPVSGALAPEVYFDYLQAGYSPNLESILEHNRLDVISLVHLHSLLMRRLQGADGAMDAADWLALGRHRFRRGARADGWRALRNAAGFSSGDAAATAGLWISRRLVRRGPIGGGDRLPKPVEEYFFLIRWPDAGSEATIHTREFSRLAARNRTSLRYGSQQGESRVHVSGYTPPTNGVQPNARSEASARAIAGGVRHLLHRAAAA